jgi:hypothetical protein
MGDISIYGRLARCAKCEAYVLEENYYCQLCVQIVNEEWREKQQKILRYTKTIKQKEPVKQDMYIDNTVYYCTICAYEDDPYYCSCK